MINELRLGTVQTPPDSLVGPLKLDFDGFHTQGKCQALELAL